MPAAAARYPQLVRAAARCRTVLRVGHGVPAEYGRQLFTHPYHSAPFILVGDWQ